MGANASSAFDKSDGEEKSAHYLKWILADERRLAEASDASWKLCPKEADGLAPRAAAEEVGRRVVVGLGIPIARAASMGLPHGLLPENDSLDREAFSIYIRDLLMALKSTGEFPSPERDRVSTALIANAFVGDRPPSFGDVNEANSIQPSKPSEISPFDIQDDKATVFWDRNVDTVSEMPGQQRLKAALEERAGFLNDPKVVNDPTDSLGPPLLATSPAQMSPKGYAAQMSPKGYGSPKAYGGHSRTLSAAPSSVCSYRIRSPPSPTVQPTYGATPSKQSFPSVQESTLSAPDLADVERERERVRELCAGLEKHALGVEAALQAEKSARAQDCERLALENQRLRAELAQALQSNLHDSRQSGRLVELEAERAMWKAERADLMSECAKWKAERFDLMSELQRERDRFAQETAALNAGLLAAQAEGQRQVAVAAQEHALLQSEVIAAQALRRQMSSEDASVTVAATVTRRMYLKQLDDLLNQTEAHEAKLREVLGRTDNNHSDRLLLKSGTEPAMSNFFG